MSDQQTQLDVPRASWIWMKDSSGYPSVTVTFVTVSFWVTTLLYVASAFQKIGPIELRPFDVAATSAYFIPILTLYFGRRWTEASTGITQARMAVSAQTQAQVQTEEKK